MNEELVTRAARIAALEHIGPARNLQVRIENGGISVFASLIVVESVENPLEEIDLTTALKVDPQAVIGDELRCDVTPHNFGRMTAEACRRVVNLSRKRK